MAEEPTPIPNAFAPVSRDAWQAQVEADLKGKPLSSLNTTLEPGITLSPLYTAADVPAQPAGLPGAAAVHARQHPARQRRHRLARVPGVR
jgi:methylmalonyl-CoA mutase